MEKNVLLDLKQMLGFKDASELLIEPYRTEARCALKRLDVFDYSLESIMYVTRQLYGDEVEK